MQKKSGMQEGIVTFVGGSLLCMFITGAAYEKLDNMLVFMGIIFLSSVIVVCTYRIVDAIKDMKEMQSDDKSIEYTSKKSNVDNKVRDKYGR